MLSDDVVLCLEHVVKRYRLYQRPYDRLKDVLAEWFGDQKGRGRFQDHCALQGVDLTIYRGETVGIIGVNGSGKSTLLQVLAGILTPSAGTVCSEGRVAALLELGAGFNPEFSGKENVFLNAALFGLSSREVEARLSSILEFADIGDYVDQPVKTYSSGMVVRLAFAVMANVDADVLIIDEALAVGDVFFVQKCIGYLREFMTRGTMVFVSHDTNMILNLCNRAVLMDDGRLILDGAPKQVVERYLARMHGARGTSVEGEHATSSEQPTFPRDARQHLLVASKFRNDIEVFEFDPNAGAFGHLGAEIIGLRISDADGAPCSWVVGGEEVKVQISCCARSQISHPIVGFYVKDKLGQMIFGDNTFPGRNVDAEIAVGPGDILHAEFQFRMPVLPAGDYTICGAIADGNQEHHQQQHWIHDAVVLRSHASSVFKGLVGVPMARIDLSVERTTSGTGSGQPENNGNEETIRH